MHYSHCVWLTLETSWINCSVIKIKPVVKSGHAKMCFVRFLLSMVWGVESITIPFNFSVACTVRKLKKEKEKKNRRESNGAHSFISNLQELKVREDGRDTWLRSIGNCLSSDAALHPKLLKLQYVRVAGTKLFPSAGAFAVSSVWLHSLRSNYSARCQYSNTLLTLVFICV